ncbi:MAG TPA: hypothetical protein VHS31_17880 [Tepidisphaeraceae bacterium]|jgi:hypothetical protein|nr:hypothetical protein [Tepidisphaeraceae bacterium]
MSVVPDKAIDKVQFFENHITPWTTNAVAIGTTTTIVTDLGTKTTAARAAYNAQQTAQETAKAATLAFQTAVSAMAVAGASIISQIRAKASITGDSVYSLAQIPAPATPSPKPAPGTPTDFNVSLNADGSLELGWKCVNPTGTTGTIYQVWRRIGPTADFVYLGGSGTKDFIDDTVPTGSSQLTYQIQAVRSTAVGAWAQFNVNFGTTSGGTMTASVEETTAPAAKKAA